MTGSPCDRGQRQRPRPVFGVALVFRSRVCKMPRGVVRGEVRVGLASHSALCAHSSLCRGARPGDLSKCKY